MIVVRRFLLLQTVLLILISLLLPSFSSSIIADPIQPGTKSQKAQQLQLSTLQGGTGTATPLIQPEGDIKVDELKKKVDELGQQLQSMQSERNAAMAAAGDIERELKDSKQDITRLEESIKSYESGYGLGAQIALGTISVLAALIALVSAWAYFELKRRLQSQVHEAHENMVKLSKARTGASVYNFLSQTVFNYYYNLYLATKTHSAELLHAVNMSVTLSEVALDLAREARQLSDEITDKSLLVRTMNSYAFHLAVYRYPDDSAKVVEALEIAENLYEHAEKIRRMKPSEKHHYPDWYDLFETYVRVILTYSQDTVKLEKAVGVYKKLCDNGSLPAVWLEKTQQAYSPTGHVLPNGSTLYKPTLQLQREVDKEVVAT